MTQPEPGNGPGDSQAKRRSQEGGYSESLSHDAHSRGPVWTQEQDKAVTMDAVVPAAHGSEDRKGEGTDDGKDEQPPPLPFSKARCIALVATVTGAAFLNVRPSIKLLPPFKSDDDDDC